MRALRGQLDRCAKAQGLLGLALLLAVLGWFMLGYRPMTARLGELKMQIEARQRELSGNNSRVSILPGVIDKVNELRARLEKFDKQLPRQQELERFIKDIDAMVHSAELRKVTVEPALLPQRSELYAELPVSLKFEGDFLSVFSFLRQTEEMQRLTRVKNLNVRSSQRSQNPGQVEVELSMNIYFSEG